MVQLHFSGHQQVGTQLVNNVGSLMILWREIQEPQKGYIVMLRARMFRSLIPVLTSWSDQRTKHSCA